MYFFGYANEGGWLNLERGGGFILLNLEIEKLVDTE